MSLTSQFDHNGALMASTLRPFNIQLVKTAPPIASAPERMEKDTRKSRELLASLHDALAIEPEWIIDALSAAQRTVSIFLSFMTS